MIEILTALLVLITGLYAYLTLRIAKASEASVAAIEAQSRASLRAYVTVQAFIQPTTLFLCLRIRNTGRTAATHLRLALDRDFYQYGERKLQERNLRTRDAFSIPIASFPPDAELLFTLGQGWVIFGESADESATPLQFKVTADYETLGHRTIEATSVDLRPFLNSEGSRNGVVDELEKIREAIQKLATR